MRNMYIAYICCCEWGFYSTNINKHKIRGFKNPELNNINMNKILFFLGIIVINNLCAYAQVEDPNFHIYLLMGQSNMAGRGQITDEFQQIQHDSVQMLDSNYKWIEAKHPVHFDKPKVAGVGPGLSFGIAMAEADP